jgi:hypothetical protein
MHNLYKDVSIGSLDEDTLKVVWTALSDFIFSKLSENKGVSIENFGVFARFRTGSLLWRPAAEFKKNLSCMEPSNAPQFPVMKLPFSAIAVGAGVPQDTAVAAIKRMVAELATQARNGLTLTISFGKLGTLWSRGRSVGFRFAKTRTARTRKGSRRSSRTRSGQQQQQQQQQAAAEVQNPEPIANPAKESAPEPEDKEEITSTDTAVLDKAEEESLPTDLSILQPQKQYKKTVLEAIRAREPEKRPKRDLPAFLRPDRFRGRQTSAALRAQAQENQYEHLAALLAEQQTRLDARDHDIALRNERAELRHRANLERKQREKATNFKLLAQLAEEKRVRDREAEYDHRMLRDPAPEMAIPQEIDPPKDLVAQVKADLRGELDKQVLENRIRLRKKQKDTLKQERYLLDSLHQELVEDHIHRAKEKRATTKRLQEEWARQSELSRISKSLQEHEYM